MVVEVDEVVVGGDSGGRLVIAGWPH